MRLIKIVIGVVLALVSTSCAVIKDPILINYAPQTTLKLQLPPNVQKEEVDPVDVDPIVPAPAASTAPVVPPPVIIAPAPPLPPASGGFQGVRCPVFRQPYLGNIPSLSPEERAKLRGADSRTREKILVDHIEVLDKYIRAEQDRVKKAVADHRRQCSVPSK